MLKKSLISNNPPIEVWDPPGITSVFSGDAPKWRLIDPDIRSPTSSSAFICGNTELLHWRCSPGSICLWFCLQPGLLVHTHISDYLEDHSLMKSQVKFPLCCQPKPSLLFPRHTHPRTWVPAWEMAEKWCHEVCSMPHYSSFYWEEW